jgi:predicted phage replisome organizer/uncharacterized phage protein (TIGR02220 family)
MENGKDYVILLLKMKLRALKSDGYLRVTEMLPYDVTMLANVTGTNIDVVRVAIPIFEKCGLIEKMDDGAIYMTCMEELIGSESAVAQRVRQHREKVKELEDKTEDVTLKQNVTKMKHRDRDRDRVRDRYIYSEDEQDILQHLNAKAGRNYRRINEHTTARLKEYSVEDLKMVIDWKVCEWAGGEMAKYLTQETLFSVKHFDTYLDDARRNLAGVEKKAYDKYCDEFYQAHMSLPLEERRGKRPLAIEEWRKACTPTRT